MSDLVDRALRATRRSKSVRSHRRRRFDDAATAAHHDSVREYDRPRVERSKDAYELADSLPVVDWTPPARRPQM